jgi:hypothetical protein
VNLRKSLLNLLTSFALTAALALPCASQAAGAVKGTKSRTLTSFEGRITKLRNARDVKKKRYWEYSLRTKTGKVVIVHDYQYGRYRKPASVGLKEGTKYKVRGFFVKISPKLGAKKKESVLIVSAKN